MKRNLLSCIKRINGIGWIASDKNVILKKKKKNNFLMELFDCLLKRTLGNYYKSTHWYFEILKKIKKYEPKTKTPPATCRIDFGWYERKNDL